MKTLSIKQPWASLIAHGIKDVENRTWKTNYRGRIYIHASGKPSFDSLPMGLTQAHINEVLKYNHRKYDPLFHDKGLVLASKERWIYSAIIGEVDIIDCVLDHSSLWAERGDDLSLAMGEKPIYNWVLGNPVLYDKPILNVKGKLSLWEYERPYQVIGTAEMVSVIGGDNE